MKRNPGTGVARTTAIRLVLIAVMLTAVTSSSHAQRASRGGGGGAGGGGHVYGGRGGGSAGGGQAYYGRGSGGSNWRGGGFVGGRRFVGGTPGIVYGGRRFIGGYPYYYPRRHYPHSSFRLGLGLGFGFGYPYYPRTYVYEPYPVYVAPPVIVAPDELANKPPAGCDFYDPFCDYAFSTLDDYRTHLDDVDHEAVIEVVNKDTGKQIGTYEYVNGHWVIAARKSTI